MSAYQRRKGHDFERWVARQLGTRRGYQYRDGADAPDVVMPGWHLECKCGANPSVWAALEQAERDSAGGLLRAAIIKRDRRGVLVAMPWEDWCEVQQTLRELQNG